MSLKNLKSLYLYMLGSRGVFVPYLFEGNGDWFSVRGQ